jgi:hypothetical protein
MLGRQLDLFSATGLPAADGTAAHVEPSRLVPSNLDDSELVEALPEARVVDCHALCAEAGRRRLIAAIPALEALCRRFKGFGLEHAVPEQIAALRGLAAISTREAAAAVSRIIAESVVQGPACTMQSTPRSSSNVACRPRSRCPFYGTTMHGFAPPPVASPDRMPT